MHGLVEGYQEVLMQKVAQDKSSLMMYHLFITEGRERGHTHTHTNTRKYPSCRSPASIRKFTRASVKILNKGL